MYSGSVFDIRLDNKKQRIILACVTHKIVHMLGDNPVWFYSSILPKVQCKFSLNEIYVHI